MDTAARRDRLLNMLHRGPTTASAAASVLGVSERTVYRDIAHLRSAGHDVQTTPGPGGGVRVARDTRPRPVHFEVSEIVGLALSVAILKATPHVPFAQSAQAALDRACRALSADRQRAMERLLARILIGGPASPRVQQSLGSVEDTVLSVFERCFAGARVMTFDYVDHRGARSSRRVECIAIALHAPVWYLVAWDLEKDASRIFRMDRITAPSCGDALTASHDLSELQGPQTPEAEAEALRRGWTRVPLG